jgi:Flp pilus assembly protein protease CpaA
MDLTNFYPSAAEVFSTPAMVIIFAAIFWMIISSIQDFKRREVENWWNYSLIVFILAFRAFFSIESNNYFYFLWGIIGLGAGFILANLFYYARMFAGGDAKLLMALGAIIPLTLNWQANIFLLVAFILLFLVCGSVYGIFYSLFLVIKNFSKFKKEFLKQFWKYNKIIISLELILIILIIVTLLFNQYLFTWLIFILFLSPLLFLYAHSIENTCMQYLVSVKDLTIGDWIVRPIKAGNKIIKPNWEGLTENDLSLIRKKVKSKVLVKSGIPFVPSFLLGFLALLYIVKYYF